MVGLDGYLRGVLPREVVASTWPPATLQAQAVAARTYAAYERAHVPAGRHYDLCDTASCQVYGGASAEYPGTDAAVAATAGQVLTSGGTPGVHAVLRQQRRLERRGRRDPALPRRPARPLRPLRPRRRGRRRVAHDAHLGGRRAGLRHRRPHRARRRDPRRQRAVGRSRRHGAADQREGLDRHGERATASAAASACGRRTSRSRPSRRAELQNRSSNEPIAAPGRPWSDDSCPTRHSRHSPLSESS